jgi:signal transduction histidine kinase
MKSPRLWLLLPIALALTGLLLLARVSASQVLLFPEDLDVVLVTSLLLLIIFFSLLLVIRERLRYWIQRSQDTARRETLAEHRRFMRRLDHELKNPLTTLQAGLSTLKMTLKDESERALVDTLSETAGRMSHLVANLRKLGDLETVSLDVSRITIAALVNEAVDLFAERAAWGEREARVQLETPLTIYGDHDLLLLALHIVLDNAIKYTRKGDSITISTTLLDDAIAITVKDSGMGIAEAEREWVWEELYRGKNVGDIPGAGIGLSLAKAIIARHHGAIHIESSEGSGTTVALLLPRAVDVQKSE